MEKVYNLRDNIYLIDHCDRQIISNKLPTNLQVLRVFFHNHCIVKLTVHESALLTVREVKLFWAKARLPSRDDQHCIKKIEDLHQQWKLIKKNHKRVTRAQQNKEAEFKKMCSTLFDIGHANVLSSDEVLEEDKQFLLLQRDGLKGYMLGEEPETSAINEEIRDSSVSEITPSDSQILGAEITSTSTSTLDSKVESEFEISSFVTKSMEPVSETKTTPDLQKTVMTTKLASALDVAKVSDRQAAHILSAACQALNVDINKITLSRSSIHRFREESRAQYAEKIQQNYKNIKSEIFTVHWDGKLLPSLKASEKKVDRLPIIITSKDSEILLGVPFLDSGTGSEQSEAVFECLTEWEIGDNIEAVCCDTEAANTGPKNGACVLLEAKLGKSLLHFLCRHHIAELLLKSAFECKFGATSGPIVPFFKTFQNAWNNLNQKNFEPGINDPEVFHAVETKIADILAFTSEKLEQSHYREDYRELLELTAIFLGGSPKRDIFIRRPGAMHQARWMSKAIYCLKIFLFRKEFSMTPDEERSCKEVCIFIVSIYVKYWFNSARADKAPNQDLLLMKELGKYSKIDQVISEAALQKIENHLWYLTPEVAAMAFFDEDLSSQEKNKMKHSLSKKSKTSKNIKRLPATTVKDIGKKSIHQFINKQSMDFFSRFKMQTSFLDQDSSEWHKNNDYNTCKDIVKNLRVTNDVAERGVKLMSDFNKLITRDEDQKQYLLQVVKEYRQQFPDCNKQTLSEEMM